MKKSELSIMLALAMTLFVIFIADNDIQAAGIRQNTLRLHIIPRDDSSLSQYIKTQVKDATEKLWPAIYCDASSFDEAVSITEKNLEYIQQVTDNTLKNLDAGYTSRCSLEKFYFDTSTADGITLPRGQYTALTIRLGKAEGKNWWSIVYPDIAIGIGGEYEDDTDGTLFETENYRIKLKTVEWWQKAKQYFTTAKVYNNL